MARLRCPGLTRSVLFRMRRVLTVAAITALAICASSTGQEGGSSGVIALPLTATDGLNPINGRVEVVEHNGRRAVRLARLAETRQASSMLAILPVGEFHNGTIELEVSGSPRAGTEEYARGFIGVAFRVKDRGAKTEEFYLRPTNGQANDPERRRHAVQYVSEPEYPWERLRKEHPGVYEAPADLQPDVWTKMKIVVSGTRAELYVNGAAQPCLTVNDLKMGDSQGGIALWAHETTEAYFSDLKISWN